LQDAYGGVDEDVLVLEGRSIYVTRIPLVWARKENRARFDRIWRTHTSEYHPEIQSLATTIASVISRQSGGFVGVHMRRGDFVDLGLLKEAEDLNRVQEYLKQHIQPGEPFYLATNERSRESLRKFRSMGAVLWEDVMQMTEVQTAIAGMSVLPSMLGFQDYVGLVEQMVCAQARLFVGTRCSSFTGQILNLRYKLLGDHRFLFFPP
jgi:hypothetical protein